MRYRILLITVAFGLLVPLSAARAAIVIKADGTAVKGILVRASAEVVVIGMPQPDGSIKEEVLGREQVDDIIETVSKDRLAELRRDNPQAYRDYAEELVVKRDDPEARMIALRLYHIAAYLDPDRLGRSCLLGMADLARTPAEERKFRAMVYLLDPDHDARLLKTADRPSEGTGPASAAASQDLASSLQLLRLDRRREAQVASHRGNVKDQFDHVKHYISYDEFVELCADRKPLSSDQQRRILLAEISLIRVLDSSGDEPKSHKPTAASSAASWSKIMATAPPTAVPSLALKTITEFDPEECEYREGKWVKP